MQVDGEPRSRLGLLVDLKPVFEALPADIGPQVIHDLVESTAQATMAKEYTIQMWLRDLEMAGFAASLSERIIASLPQLTDRPEITGFSAMANMSAYGTPLVQEYNGLWSLS